MVRMTNLPRTYTVLEAFLPRRRPVRITRFIRAATCDRPTGRHMWGAKGTRLSFALAWRTNPSGVQACGCVWEYQELQKVAA